MSRRVLVAVIALIAFVAASSASAVNYQMSGTWRQRRGSVYIPVAVSGFVPGSGAVVAMGSNPADFTVPPSIFAAMGGLVIPLAGMNLVQLSSMLSAQGPQSAGMFFDGAKGSRPANFAWCPTLVQGMGVLACVNGNQNAGIGRPGIIRYTAGAKEFGGTMQMLLIGSGEVSILNGVTGMGGIRILHNPFGGGGSANDQEAGGPFQNIGSVMLAAGNVTVQPVVPPGVITMPGPITGMGPAELNLTTGFPWTTGMVQGTNPTAVTIFPPNGTMFTGTGMDSRTMLGKGNIVMVAGGITRRTTAGQSYIHFDTLNLTMVATNPVPAMSGGAFGAVALVVLLSAGYMLRRRLA